jgi:hypothetical protein
MMKNLIFHLAIVFLAGSCKKDHNLEKIDSDILVSASMTENSISITCQTERIYPCLGYQITYCDKMRNNEIFVEFKKVQLSGICLAMPAPASCTVDLGALKAGEYNLVFKLNDQKTEGKLIIGSTVELALDSGGNVKPE